VSIEEKLKLNVKWKVEKFKAKDSKEIAEKNIKPYEVVETDEDVALNEGLQNVIDIICGLGTTTLYNNANARLGVGNDGTAPDPSQTGLLGASQLYKGMNTGYPQRSGQQAQWQSDFVDGEAEWAWLEETIDNGATASKNLCRQNTNLGTKPAGQTWRLTGTITFS